MTPALDDVRQRTWDFGLTFITMLLLATLGLQSFVGTLFVWLQIRTVPGWETGAGYNGYVATMNAIAAPQIVALVVVMGLCVPKRLFARRALLAVSLAMVGVGTGVALMARSLTDGIVVYLVLAAAIQLAVVAMTVAGVRGPSYLTEGRLTKSGSGLLHLGFIIFAIVVVALQNSPLMLPAFSASALLVTVGTALSFYAWRIAWHRPQSERESAFRWNESEHEEPEAVDGDGDVVGAVDEEVDSEPGSRIGSGSE